METIAEKLTNYIVRQKVINKEDYAIYKYGIQSGLEILLCVLICLLVAGKMKLLPECIFLMSIFFSQRTYVKGVHLKHFWSCCIMSCGIILLGIFLSQRVYIDRYIMMMIITFCQYVVNSLTTQCFLKELKKEEAIFYRKRRIIIFLVIWIGALVCTLVGNMAFLFIIFYAEVVIFISVYVEKISKGISLF